MKLVLFIDTLKLGGAERFASTFANHWVQAGWQVVLVTSEDSSHDAYELHSDVERISLGVADAIGPLTAVLSIARRTMALRGILRRIRPDIAMGITPQPCILLGLARLGLGIPIVGAERTYPPMVPMNPRWKLLHRLIYPTLNHIVVQTTAGADWIRTHTRASRVSVVPNPIPYPLPLQAPYVPVPTHRKGRCLLLSAGRLEGEKQFDRLLRAFARLAERFPDWDLAILGDGGERNRLEGLCKELNLGGRLMMPGRVGNMGDWYVAADVFVLTSRFEGFPNVLAEAMVHGLPAVSVDCLTGPRDIIRPGIDGILVPVDDEEQLVHALATLMGDQELRKSMGERAKDARTRFAVADILARWQQIFCQLRP